jgi:CheY-like chemotaxis protein
VTTQILAVDDSVTMRKILEITFSGSGFQLHVVATPEEAQNRLREGGIAAVLCDGSLEPSGYDVAQQLKSIAPSVPILLLASRQNPYDAARGQAAGIEDNIVKPFDTAQLLERVGKLVSGGATLAVTTPAPAPTPSLMAAAGAPVTANTVATPPKAAATPATGSPAASAPASSSATANAAKGRTMLGQGPAGGGLPAQKPAGFGSSAGRPAVSATAPMPRSSVAPAPPPSRPGSTASAPAVSAPPAVAAAAVAAPAAAAPAATAVGQALASASAKIEGMGLTSAQADAVLALSRELVEKVVWEVVPVLAETLIKEEIARLTK